MLSLHGLVWLTPPTGQEFIFTHADHELENGKAQLLDSGVAEPTLLFEQHIITEELKSRFRAPSEAHQTASPPRRRGSPNSTRYSIPLRPTLSLGVTQT